MFGYNRRRIVSGEGKLKTISLLARRVAQRIEDINNQLKNKANDFEWFSLAFDELTDVTNTARLFI